MKLLTLSIIASFLLSSCTAWNARQAMRYGAGAVATLVLAGGYKAYIDKKRQREQQTTPVIENIDTTGTMIDLGGMLINDHQVLHVTHWPIKSNQVVAFRQRGGGVTRRRVKSKKDLGTDLSLITLDSPIDLNLHTLLPIESPAIDQPATVLRFRDRSPIGTRISGINDHNQVVIDLSDEDYLETGDSGKIVVQQINGTVAVVTFNSKSSGLGPHIKDIWNSYLDRSTK